MDSFSQNVPCVALPSSFVSSSPIVVRVLSNPFGAGGDCVYGSGEVPQDELGPPWEFEEAGELWLVLWPLLLFAVLESVLDLDTDL